MQKKEADLAKRYGEKIRQLRQRLGLTQCEFAEKIGTGQRNITHWESGKALISTVFIDMICKTFSIRMSYWDTESEEEVAISAKFESIRKFLEEFQKETNHRYELEGRYTEIRLYSPEFSKGLQVHKSIDTGEIFLDATDIFLNFGVDASQILSQIDKIKEEKQGANEK